MEQKKRGGWVWVVAAVVVCAWAWARTAEGAGLAEKCSQVVQQVIPCLNFATGKETVPTKDCCDASSKIKDTAPECLCYVIQQTHKGSPEVKSMGIQEARLIQLPSACHLNNASISNCPKLLGLPANSPDAAIFTNTSSGNSTTASSVSGTTPTSQNDSYGSITRPALVVDVVAVGLALLLVAIPAGFTAIYS